MYSGQNQLGPVTVEVKIMVMLTMLTKQCLTYALVLRAMHHDKHFH